MSDFAYYQIYLQAGLDVAEQYLLSDNLFESMSIASSIGMRYPSLTIGNLLLYQKFAWQLAKMGSEQGIIQKLDTQLDAMRSRWRVAWERKTAWEFEARLRQWGNALKEIRDDPGENLAYYHHEVRSRVLLNLLHDEAGEIDPANREHLDSLDLILQAIFKPGEFIWEQEVAPAFPKDIYWYLWGEPRDPKC